MEPRRVDAGDYQLAGPPPRFVTLYRHRGCPLLHRVIGEIRRCPYQPGWVHLDELETLTYELQDRHAYVWPEHPAETLETPRGEHHGGEREA